MTILIYPKDIKLLLSKCIRGAPIHYTSHKVLEFTKDMNICYDIVIKNIKGFNKIEFCFNSNVLYSKDIKKNYNKYTTIKIKSFTKDQPLLLTHITKKMLNFKLYKEDGYLQENNINISFVYENIDTHKYSSVWNYIPVTHCINNTFLLYKNNCITTIHISEIAKNKKVLINEINLYKEEWCVEIYVNNINIQDILQVKHLYTYMDYVQSGKCCIRLFINDNKKLNDFINYANIKWGSDNIVSKQLTHDINSIFYIDIHNLISELIN